MDADDWKLDRIGAAEAGCNPMVISKMEGGYAVIGDTQFLPGYCVLLATPRVSQLNDLPLPTRVTFLRDMSLLGDAIAQACIANGLRRINYEILGNTDTYLHAHVFPRYTWESEERASKPAFLYPPDRWTSEEFQYSQLRHGELRESIRVHLEAVLSGQCT